MAFAIAVGGCQPRAAASHPTHQSEEFTEAGGFQLALHGLPRWRVLRGDWEPPATLLISYQEDWRHVLGELAAAARSETEVIVVVRPEDSGTRSAQRWLGSLELDSIVIEHDTGWIRDYGPFEVLDEFGLRRWVDMGYAEDRPLDDNLPQSLGNLTGRPVERQGLMLDGGGLISNGAGHCAMTETTFGDFASVDTIDLATQGIEKLGCRVLSVVPSLTEEDTGHIDVVAQFLSPGVVAVAEVDPSLRPDDAAILDETDELLRAGAEQLGQALRVVRVPLVVRGDTHYSYINGTRLRNSLLVPAYLTVPEDVERLAYERLRSGLSGNVELVPIYADELAKLGGAVHCVTLGLGDKLLGTGTSLL